SPVVRSRWFAASGQQEEERRGCGPGGSAPAHAAGIGRRAEDQPPFCAWIAAVMAGRIFSASPTMPRSAYWKIGASLSLLMAMIRLDVFMPTRCWIAPLIPTAI